MNVFILIAFLTILGFISIEDLRTMEISDKWHMYVLILGVINIFIGNGNFHSSILGFFGVSVPMLILALLCPGSIGGGDIKMVASSGFLLGLDKIVLGSGAGFLLGGLYGCWLLLVRRKKSTDHFPFGPWLAAGIGAAAIGII